MEYTLQVDGEEIDSSKGQAPLQFLVGHGNIISGLEREMMGMKVGESKDVVIQPGDAYGEFDDQAFMNVPRGEFPNDMPLQEGLELSVRDDSGQSRYARVDTIEGDNVAVSGNAFGATTGDYAKVEIFAGPDGVTTDVALTGNTGLDIGDVIYG